MAPCQGETERHNRHPPQRPPTETHRERGTEAHSMHTHTQRAAHRETHTTHTERDTQHTQQHNSVTHIHTQYLNLVHTQTFDIRALAALARVVCARGYLQKKFVQTAGYRQRHPPSLKVYTTTHTQLHSYTAHTHSRHTQLGSRQRHTARTCTAHTHRETHRERERQYTQRHSTQRHSVAHTVHSKYR